jgi:hypothetical protein
MALRAVFLLSSIILLTLPLWSQEQRVLHAARIASAPRIDGILNDTAWTNAEVAGGFIQNKLDPGAPSVRNTELRIVYDNEALYIGAELHDTSGDSVLRELSTRDIEANSDLFGVAFDTYNDDINAFAFLVTASGTQIDGRISGDDFNTDWNTVWISAVKVHSGGWTVEMKIPYSALRFPKKEIQKWGFNAIRKVRRLREESYWNFVDPKIESFVRQFGDLEGIANIKPPVRLSFTPYLAGLAEHYPYRTPGISDLNYNLSGGMDVKYGISDAFTLDMTLVPDFSQVQSDNQVLNLSPFEVQFQERRPFFTEGTELFNKGGLFYSRRVGGRPIDYSRPYNETRPGERVIKNPSQTQLLNATKLSGRTPSKLGIGLFNAVSNRSYALLEDSAGSLRRILTAPLTNYNIVVLDQALKNNSSLNFVNTNVTREGGYQNANVFGSGLQLNNKKNRYALNASGAFSSIQRPGVAASDVGYRSDFAVLKNGGNLRWQVFGSVKSDRFNPNDLGIQQLGNNIETGVYFGYHIFKPVWRVNNMYNNVTVLYQRMYNPDAFWNFGIYGNHNTTFTKRFVTCGVHYGLEPVITYDYYEPRTFGRFYTFPRNYNMGGFVSTDYRRRFALDLWGEYRTFIENNRYNLNLSVSPRYRVNNRLSFIYEVERNIRHDDIGYVNANEARDTITFGRRNLITVSNVLSSLYKFTNKMSLSFRLRHYWSKAEYQAYYFLGTDGSLDAYDYNSDHNVNFNALNIDIVYFWQFAPGSEMNIVWKTALLKSDKEIAMGYFDNFNGAFNTPQNNSLSVKVLFYFDYQMVKKRMRQISGGGHAVD